MLLHINELFYKKNVVFFIRKKAIKAIFFSTKTEP